MASKSVGSWKAGQLHQALGKYVAGPWNPHVYFSTSVDADRLAAQGFIQPYPHQRGFWYLTKKGEAALRTFEPGVKIWPNDRYRPEDHYAGGRVATRAADQKDLRFARHELNDARCAVARVERRHTKRSAHRADGPTASLTRRQVAALMKKHGIPGKLTGKGRDWEVEVPSYAYVGRFRAYVTAVGGYKTGYGAWVLRPGYQPQGDWNDKTSRSHY